MSKQKENASNKLVHPAATDSTPARLHETRDLDLRAAFMSGVVLLVALSITLIVTTAMQFVFTGRLPDLLPPSGGLTSNPPNPVPTAVTRRQNPQDEASRVRDEEDQLLHSYGWVDQNAGVVRIPIERAMDLLLQRGLPTRPESESNQFQDKGEGLPSSASSGRMMERAR